MKAQKISAVMARAVARDVLNASGPFDPYSISGLEDAVNDRLRYVGAGWHIPAGTYFDAADRRTIKALTANVQRAAVPGTEII